MYIFYYLLQVEMGELLTQDPTPIEMGSRGTITWASNDVYLKVMGPK